MTDLDDVTVLSDASLALVEELRSTREHRKALESREAEIRKALLSELTDAAVGITASGATAITVQRQNRTRVDSKRLQALYEDAWEDCQVESVVEVLDLPDVLEDIED